jgi:hypothetical protein
MLEHEHGDHPDYYFPIEVECTEIEEAVDDYGDSRQSHALIYTDGYVAITIYEHCYAMWLVDTGLCIGGSLWKNHIWKITEASRILMLTVVKLKKLRREHAP